MGLNVCSLLYCRPEQTEELRRASPPPFLCSYQPQHARASGGSTGKSAGHNRPCKIGAQWGQRLGSSNQPCDPRVTPSLHSALGQTVCVALSPPLFHSLPSCLLSPVFFLCKVHAILPGLHQPLSGKDQEWNPAAPAQTGGMLHSQAGRQTDRQAAFTAKEIAFPTAASLCQSKPGAIRKPLSELSPGRSNKTPGLLRHGHSSCLAVPRPSKATPEINGERFIRGLGVELPPPPAAPLLAGWSFLSEQAASAEKQPCSSRQQAGDLVSGRAGGGGRAHRPCCSLIRSRRPHSFRQQIAYVRLAYYRDC